jgi:succinate dehydrogenase/fumarate reductase flavoprotein subunit
VREENISVRTVSGKQVDLPFTAVHTLVIGSGAAGLNAALQLHANGLDDLLIITEGLQMGTSINTGSDKQTYYKLGMYGSEADSPMDVAEALYSGGSMHGDLALVEAGLSARAFMNLVNLGVPFPRDAFGQFVGYKTDHDPRQRATSVGPYTSKEMCECLIREVRRRGVPIRENRLAVSLLTLGEEPQKRVAGAIALNYGGDHDNPEQWASSFEIYVAENIIFAVGGPGGLYMRSVYPEVHNGAIGVSLMAGAEARNLPEFQYGLGSTKFRWNVSGSYMQVIPRFLSTQKAGHQEEREFLKEYFDAAGPMCTAVFLKGYQWPFDTEKIVGGSSIVDILVYIETVVRERRVFLDYSSNPEGFRFEDLSPEAREYLTKSGALRGSPIERLEAMNPDAIQLYKDHGIDMNSEPLEIAVCAQHNNGGLAATLWWESTNIKHLFPIGEVNGSHGVRRPGGSALNAGQVGGFRAAEYIAHHYAGWTLDMVRLKETAAREVAEIWDWIARSQNASSPWRAERREFQGRMTSAGAHVRSLPALQQSVDEARQQWRSVHARGCGFRGFSELPEVLHTRQLCYAHVVYLEAMLSAVQSGLGSRGSAIVLQKDGIQAHPKLGEQWRFAPENPDFRSRVLKTVAAPDGSVKNRWGDRRPIPTTDGWFETTWAAFKRGDVYKSE